MKPCPNCPWRRSVEPGALGGSEPEVYIGQSVGPYKIPCHAHYINIPYFEKVDALMAPDCIGAAIFRANIRISHLLPPALLRMPPDKEAVFANHAEFLAHHKQISVTAAHLQLVAKGPMDHLQDQARSSGNVVMLVPRK